MLPPVLFSLYIIALLEKEEKSKQIFYVEISPFFSKYGKISSDMNNDEYVPAWRSKITMYKVDMGKEKIQRSQNLFLVLLFMGIVCIINSCALLYELVVSDNLSGAFTFTIIDLTSIIILVIVGIRGWVMRERLKRTLDVTIETFGRSEAIIDYIMHSTNSYIMFLDSNNKVISCSEALIKRLGYQDIKQIYKKSIYDLCELAKNKNIFDDIFQSVRNTNSYNNIRVFELEKETIWFSVNVNRIRKTDNNSGIVIILTDVTKEQLSKEELLEIVTMRNKVLLTMSHELRTPINGISGSVDLLSISSQLNENDRSHVQNIREACRALLSIVEQATDYNQIKNNNIVLEHKEFSLHDILDDICALAHLRAYEKKLGFCVELEPDIPMKLFGDVDKIKRVLTNLLYNAVKYTKEGYIHLGISKKEREGKLYLQYLVEDTGCGINEEHKERLFEAFYRFEKEDENNFSGLGLGLSVCQEFVRAMGGEIRCESKVGIGSTFWFEIETEVLDNSPFVQLKNPYDKNIGIFSTQKWKNEYAKRMCRELNISSYKICTDMDSILNECFTHILIEVNHPLASQLLLTELPFQCKKVLVLESSEDMLDCIQEADHIIYEPFLITVFAQVLNAYDERKKAEEKEKAAANLVFQTKGVKALAVDDNAVNLMVVSNILQQYNIDVDEADSGKFAIQKYYNEAYDLIFMDYLMPDMDGIETTKNIRNLKKKKEPFIIALSANVNLDIKEKFEQAGADYVMSKPIELKELSEILHKYLPQDKILEEEKLIEENKNEITLEALQTVLKEVDYLDVEKGLVHMAGSIESYVRVLNVCCENVTEQIEHIKAGYHLVSANDLKIYFHSLKGILLNVGADQLADQSKELEQASANGDITYIEEHVGKYVEAVEYFCQKLQSALGLYKNILASTIPEEEYQPMIKDEFKEKLNILIEYVKRFEYNESSELAQSLVSACQEDIKVKMLEAYEQIQQFQYENAIEILENIQLEF